MFMHFSIIVIIQFSLAFSDQIAKIENEFAAFLHAHQLSVEERITLIELIFFEHTELLMEKRQKFPKMELFDNKIAKFPYDFLIDQLKRKMLDNLVDELRTNLQKLAQNEYQKYAFLVGNKFFEKLLTFWSNLATAKVDHKWDKKSEILAKSEEDKILTSDGQKSVQFFVEMYQFGEELFMQLAGVFPPKYKKIKKLAHNKVPKLTQLSETFFDVFFEHFWEHIPHQFKIKPSDNQKIIFESDTCRSWLKWLHDVARMAKIEWSACD